MGTYRQALLYNLPTLMTLLTGETRVHSNNLMTSSCGLLLKDVEECAPRGVENALGQMVIFHHVGDLKVFHRNVVILFSIALRRLELVISSRTNRDPLPLTRCSGRRSRAWAGPARQGP